MLHGIVFHGERRIPRLDVQRSREDVGPHRIDVAAGSRQARVRCTLPKGAIAELETMSSEMTSRRIDGIHEVDILVMAPVDRRNGRTSQTHTRGLIGAR